LHNNLYQFSQHSKFTIIFMEYCSVYY